MSPCAAAEASVSRTARPSTATFLTLTLAPATHTSNALAAGTELSSSASSYLSTSIASMTVAERRTGAVVSSVVLTTARSLTFAAALPATSRIGSVAGAV